MFFWNSLAFSMLQWMLAIWSLVHLPFLKPAWTSGGKSNSQKHTCCLSAGGKLPWWFGINANSELLPFSTPLLMQCRRLKLLFLFVVCSVYCGSSRPFYNVMFFCVPRLWFYFQWIGVELERWHRFFFFFNIETLLEKGYFHSAARNLYGITIVFFYYRKFPKRLREYN